MRVDEINFLLYLYLRYTIIVKRGDFMIYIHRDVEDGAFMQWYNSNKNCVGFKKALVVYGARQVGKTTTIKHFANEHFQNVYYFNLKEDDFAFGTLKNAVYRDNYDFMYNLMQILTNGNFIDDINSVIIFDEVQSVRSEERRVGKECM